MNRIGEIIAFDDHLSIEDCSNKSGKVLSYTFVEPEGKEVCNYEKNKAFEKELLKKEPFLCVIDAEGKIIKL